jgi:leader peptidase (prepilin peptidase)/N-methyltransferase
MQESLLALFCTWPFGLFILLVGLCIGSFLNVCIYRIPAGKSIVSPGSHCQACLVPIAWYDNVPVLSYLILGGKCRKCGAGFSARYMLVELVTGLVWFGYWLAYFKLGVGTAGRPDEVSASMPGVYLVHMALASALLVSGIIDYDRKEIYTSVTNLSLGIGIVGSAVWPELQRLGAYGHELAERTGWAPTDAVVMSLVGAAVGAGLINITRFLGTLAFRKEAMGAGDAYLMAAIGGVLGWEAAVLVFFAAPFIGLPFGIYQLLRQKRPAEAKDAGAPDVEEPLPPPKLSTGTFLATVAGFVLLVAATAAARTEWGIGARLTLMAGLLAFGLGMFILSREEPPPIRAVGPAMAGAEGESPAPVLPEDSHEMPYGPSLGMAAGVVMLLGDKLTAWFGPGLGEMWRTLVG